MKTQESQKLKKKKKKRFIDSPTLFFQPHSLVFFSSTNSRVGLTFLSLWNVLYLSIFKDLFIYGCAGSLFGEGNGNPLPSKDSAFIMQAFSSHTVALTERVTEGKGLRAGSGQWTEGTEALRLTALKEQPVNSH